MERGALGESIQPNGTDGDYWWETFPIWGKVSEGTWDEVGLMTSVYKERQVLARFYGESPIRLERVALFLATEQS